MSISVVMPAYNEAEVINQILDRLCQIDELDEIIVVDDGSSDNTAEVVRNYANPKVKLNQHPYNIGNGAAVKTGIRAATGDIIILMDADGQHPPEEIRNMLPSIEQYAMVVGARSKSHGTVSAWNRDIANKIFNQYASYLIGYTVPDLTSGFRIIHANIVRKFLYLLPNGYSYPTTITVSLFRAGYPVKYHPFASPQRTGVSKIRPLYDGLRFLLILTRLAVFFVPLKVFIPLGVFFLIPGSIYTLLRILIEQRFSGFGGLVMTLGLFIILMGLIAEQIAMLRYVNSDQ
jgi:glycosyltransferase involved in cell wall biosynthesis